MNPTFTARPAILTGRAPIVNVPTAQALHLGFSTMPVAGEGLYQLQGTVLRNAVPYRALVLLIDAKTGGVVRRTVSRESDGAYSFVRIAKGPYNILAVDLQLSQQANAVIADNIHAEKMP